MKESELFDMKSETCLLLLVVIVWKCEYFFIFLAKCFFITVWFRFSCMYFLTIRMALIKNNFVCIWFSWNFSLQLFPAWFQVEKAGQLNSWVPLFHLDWYHFKWKWNSSSTLRKRQIIEKVKCKTGKKRLTCFYNFFIL